MFRDFIASFSSLTSLLYMAPKSKQAKHCRKIAIDRLAKKTPEAPQPNPKLSPRLMVMNGLLTGNSYEGVKKQATMMNTPTPSKRTFFNCQKQVLTDVINTVKESCKQNADNIRENSSISIDGQWNHKRHGSYSTVSFFDQKQKKIVDFESVSNGNYGANKDVKSSNMETVGIEKGLNELDSKIADLENENWGSRFPLVMNELYQGKLEAGDVDGAIREVLKIQLDMTLTRFHFHGLLKELNQNLKNPQD